MSSAGGSVKHELQGRYCCACVYTNFRGVKIARTCKRQAVRIVDGRAYCGLHVALVDDTCAKLETVKDTGFTPMSGNFE